MAVSYRWLPVRLGALGTGRVAWLEVVWRNTCFGVTIYQSNKLLTESWGNDWQDKEKKDISYIVYLWIKKLLQSETSKRN